MKRRYEVTRTIECIIDIPDDKIDDILEDFKSSISSTANFDSLFEQIAHSIVVNCEGFVEGIGQEGDEFIFDEVDCNTEYDLLEDIN